MCRLPVTKRQCDNAPRLVAILLIADWPVARHVLLDTLSALLVHDSPWTVIIGTLSLLVHDSPWTVIIGTLSLLVHDPPWTVIIGALSLLVHDPSWTVIIGTLSLLLATL